MSAPASSDLGPEQPWRPAPMPGSNQPLDLVRLASAPGHFTIHGRFPAGFERAEAGGYAKSEEFAVLDGELQLEGVAYRRGDLVVVPAWFERQSMRAPQGARVLAWFAGPPVFVPPEELEPCAEPIVSARVDAGLGLPGSGVAAWSVATAGGTPDAEVVRADLGAWALSAVPEAGDLVRRTR